MSSIFFTGFHIKKLLFQNEKNPTIELLKSSVMVSISGIFRVYLAALLLQTNVSLLTCLAGGLIIYSVYTLDRTLDCEEDLINQKELSGSRKEIGLAVTVLTFLMGSYILAKEGLLVIAFLPIVTGVLYSKGLKLGGYNLRLKGGLGVKNLVVGITWGIFIACVAGLHCTHLYSIVLIFILYGVKTFINSTIDDFKDIKGDTLAGIQTLPLYLGEQKTRGLLLVLHIFTHLILIIAFDPVIILCSFLFGLICILRYTNEERYKSKIYEMLYFKDGESVFTLIMSLIFMPYFN